MGNIATRSGVNGDVADRTGTSGAHTRGISELELTTRIDNQRHRILVCATDGQAIHQRHVGIDQVDQGQGIGAGVQINDVEFVSRIIQGHGNRAGGTWRHDHGAGHFHRTTLGDIAR